MFVRRIFSTLAIGDTFRLAVDGADATRISAHRALNIAQKATFAVGAKTTVFVFQPDPTPEEIMARRIERFVDDLKRTVTLSTDQLAEWRATLDTNPLTAFEWADRAFTAAAMRDVSKRLLAIFTGQGDDVTPRVAFERTLAEARAEMQRLARYPSRSTSASSNHAHLEVLAAYATILSTHDTRSDA